MGEPTSILTTYLVTLEPMTYVRATRETRAKAAAKKADEKKDPVTVASLVSVRVTGENPNRAAQAEANGWRFLTVIAYDQRIHRQWTPSLPHVPPAFHTKKLTSVICDCGHQIIFFTPYTIRPTFRSVLTEFGPTNILLVQFVPADAVGVSMRPQRFQSRRTLLRALVRYALDR